MRLIRHLKLKQLLVILSFTSLLSACVTTSDSSLTRKADPGAAAEKYVQLGLEYIKRDEYSRARRHLTRALEIEPENAASNAALGLIYHRDGESEIAESYFLKSLEAQPDYTRGRTYYGAFLFSEQRYQDALAQFKLASEDPAYQSRAQIFTNIALCHMKLNQYEEAITAYEKTLRLDRYNGRALSGITQLFIDLNNFQRAQYYYNSLINLISQQGLKHTAQSLWMGIQISRHFGVSDQEQSLVNLLSELYPESSEYAQYLKLVQGG